MNDHAILSPMPPSQTAPSRRAPLVEPELLALQGAAACAFLLGMGALLLAAQTTIYWQPGQLARLIGLLWAVPATTIMTYRYALRGGSVDDPLSYLERMRLVRRVALAVLLLGIPWVQWVWQRGAIAPFSADLVWPMVLSLALCWGVGCMAEHVVQVWFVLQARDWEEIATLECAGLPRVYPRPGMIDRGYLIGKLWLWWLLGSLALAALLAAHGPSAQARDAIPFGWWPAGFVCYLVLGPLLVGQATAVGRQTQWRLERVRIAPGMMAAWGQVALSITLLALLGVGLLLGGLALAHDATVWACSLVHLPTFSASTPPALPRHTASSIPAHTPVARPASGADHGWALPPALGTACAVAIVAAVLLIPARLLLSAPRGSGHPRPGADAAGAAGGQDVDALALAAAPLWLVQAVARRLVRIVGAVWWSRTQRRGAVSRWTVLAAVLLELGRYSAWLLARLRRVPVPAHAEEPAQSPPPRRRRVARERPLSSMQPAEAVAALYRRSTDLASRHGQPRGQGQTPREHAQAVAARNPEAGEHLHRIGDVFVEARFSGTPAGAEQVRRLTESWKLLRRALRRSPLNGER